MAQPTTQEVVERANQAARVLADPTLQKAFAGVRESLITALESSMMGDSATHHEIALSLQSLKAVRRQLEKWVGDGEVERSRASR
jgi:hypothetical protein